MQQDLATADRASRGGLQHPWCAGPRSDEGGSRTVVLTREPAPG